MLQETVQQSLITFLSRILFYERGIVAILFIIYVYYYFIWSFTRAGNK